MNKEDAPNGNVSKEEKDNQNASSSKDKEAEQVSNKRCTKAEEDANQWEDHLAENLDYFIKERDGITEKVSDFFRTISLSDLENLDDKKRNHISEGLSIRMEIISSCDQMIRFYEDCSSLKELDRSIERAKSILAEKLENLSPTNLVNHINSSFRERRNYRKNRNKFSKTALEFLNSFPEIIQTKKWRDEKYESNMRRDNLIKKIEEKERKRKQTSSMLVKK